MPKTVTKMEFQVHLIQFLDLLCLAILHPSVPPTILKSGGTLLHLGFMMSLMTTTRKCSTVSFNELNKIASKEELLVYSSAVSTVLNGLLFFTSTPSGIIFNRFLFAIAHQVPTYCAELESSKKNQDGISMWHNDQIKRIATILMGCLVVGSFIDSKGGFYALVLIATSISTIATALSFQQIKRVQGKRKLTAKGTVLTLPKTMTNLMSSIKNLDIHWANWDALSIKYLLVTNAIVVFILYVVLIIVKFKGNGAWVSTTSAYQTIAILLSGIIFDKFKRRIDKLAGSPYKILEFSSIFCTVLAVLTAFSPSYKFYLLIFPFLVFSRSLIENYFVDVFELKKNQNLSKDIKTITVLAEILSPLFIGLLFYLFSYNAYRLLMIIPIMGISYIVRRRRNQKEYVKIEKENEKKNTLKEDKDK